MARYTIYHPLYTGQVPRPITETYTYVTDILSHELKKELACLGHSVTLAYVNLYDNNKRLYIPEMGLDVLTDNHFPESLWFMLVNDDTHKFVLFDLQDSPAITILLQESPNYVLSLVGQYNLERYLQDTPTLDHTKLLPFGYFPYYPNLVKSKIEEINDIRLNTSKLDDRVFFLGNNRADYLHSGRRIREVISFLEYKYPDEVRVGSSEKKLSMEEFWREAAKHTISLGLPGHQWCSREHELWTLGLPVMLYEHTHHMAVDLIPNYHYIAVPVGKRLSIGMADNPEKAAHQIMKTHREWIREENRWRLNNIARNGQSRVLKHASPVSIISKVIELIQLGHW